jgi:hypothetical protein
MSRPTLTVVLAVTCTATLVFSACSDDEAARVDRTTTSTTQPATTTTAPVGRDQPAIWPAADVVLDTPEEAAREFVAEALGVPPALGEFRQGDSRSGEIDVLSLGEGGSGPPIVRGTLLLRQLGDHDGWFVIAAVNDNASITAPESAADVAAGPLVVEGRARGFEANVVVTAFEAGDRTVELDQVVTQGGAFETPEPFEVTLDLADARPGSTVVVLVRGGTGLETDPGDFGAIPVVVGG